MKRLLAIAVAFGAIAGVGAARAAQFTPPEGCAHLATVHQADCNTYQVMACGPRPRDRRMHHFRDGALRGVVDYRAGLVEVDYDERAGQPRVEIRYEGLAAVDAYDPAAEGARLELSGGYAAGVPPQVATGVSALRFGPGARKTALGARPLLEIDSWYLVELPLPRRVLRRRAVGVEYYDPALGSIVGYRLEIDSNFAGRSVEDFTPLEILTPGAQGFGATVSTACGALSDAGGPGRAARDTRRSSEIPAAAGARILVSHRAGWADKRLRQFRLRRA